MAPIDERGSRASRGPRATPPEQLLLQAEGFDAAADLLSHYDAKARTWSFAKVGSFWSAVSMAHGLGLRGQGHRVAVIDDGFDLTLPVLQERALVATVGDGKRRTHGSVVALLLTEVAPAAQLLMYPVSADGKLQPDMVAAAITQAVADGATVINLSLGRAYNPDDLRDEEAIIQFFNETRRIEGFDLDTAFLVRSLQAKPRDFYRLPMIAAMERAALEAVEHGVTVVAAAGNASGSVFSPAVLDGVVSVGFKNVARVPAVIGGTEAAVLSPLNFDQSRYTDYGLEQPEEALGSSFAAPLFSGAVCLMQDRMRLPEFLVAAGRAALLRSAWPRFESSGWPGDSLLLFDKLYEQTLQILPHNHLLEASLHECLDCALFAYNAYSDLGLIRLQSDPEAGLRYHLATIAIAPWDFVGWANSGFGCALMAMQAKEAGDVQLTVKRLNDAVAMYTKALDLRPGYEAYERRLHEFRDALANPTAFELLL